MPSPRWPMREIVSRSTTAGRNEEFAVAVAAEDRGGDDTAEAPAARSKQRLGVGADGGVHGRIADDAFLDVAPRRLELRLDERDHVGTRRQQPFDRRQHELERDEAHVDRRKVRRVGETRAVERANVGLLERDEGAAAAQFWMQLVAADIDRIDALRAALEQDFGKAAGRRADVEANAVLNVEAEAIERRRQFD